MYGKLSLFFYLNKAKRTQETPPIVNTAVTEAELREDINILLRLTAVIGAGVVLAFIIMQLAR
ncbi:hypothetical protein WH297_06460 [Ochrobactrum vermis]|uniref:Uncharacterized protein n=1 Tax=Ochrobactrum vermis TaxID=1827297 RepID=A0ABU8PAU9_9HYPH|nr:hypothetical protein [Ochrobactrum vermis]PQZ29857.1 hypothetical protein CQZ93_06600 [Ochrobactrum vermis]